jgi:hypothetical protein
MIENQKLAAAIVDVVLTDLSDRRGIRQEMGQIDEEVMVKMLDTLCGKVGKVLARANPPTIKEQLEAIQPGGNWNYNKPLANWEWFKDGSVVMLIKQVAHGCWLGEAVPFFGTHGAERDTEVEALNELKDRVHALNHRINGES